ncbi:ABC transporter transmembrane domain-containing protein [Streptomyces lydicus]
MVKPDTEPGVPDSRGVWRYVWWLVVSQRHRVLAGSLLGSSWMVGLILPPFLMSQVVDKGLGAGDSAALVGWVAVLLGVGLLNAWLAVMRHRTMTRVRMDAVFRTVRAVTGQATRLGADLPRLVTTGEVATIGIVDVWRISQILTITGPGVGAVIAYAVVSALLFPVSVLLALVVLLGVPLLAILVGPLLGRLQSVETVYRRHQGDLAGQFVDIVEGLRVLNGLGGKNLHAQRYGHESRKLRVEGYRVGAVTSWIHAFGIGLPAVFLAAVTWLAARLAAEGNITVGQMVAVYGYVAVLVVPVSFFIEGARDLGRGLVAARQVVDFLNLPLAAQDQHHSSGPTEPAVIHDPDTGVLVPPGQLTALVSASSAETVGVIERMAGLGASAVTWGGIPLDELVRPTLRDRIVVADNEADLFSGTLREVVSGRRDHDEEAVSDAVQAAMATDIVHALPNGLDSAIEAQGRNLSGGQRQRIRLARALLADPEVLLAVEPTSALDAHTEAAVGSRLRVARTGRTTVITTTSPLLLDHTDTVYYLVEGRVAAAGEHRALLRDHSGYRQLVARGASADDEPSADGPGDRFLPADGSTP